MNGSKAKSIRKQVYDDHSYYGTRYIIVNPTGTVKCVGYRAVYKLTKKGEKR